MFSDSLPSVRAMVVVCLMFPFDFFSSTVTAQTLQQTVESFFPPALSGAVGNSNGAADQLSCYAVYDSNTVVAAYSDFNSGDVVLLKTDGSGQYQETFDTGLLTEGGDCTVRLIALSPGQPNQVIVSFFSMRSTSIDEIFSVSGNTLTSIGPTRSDQGQPMSILSNVESLDLYHDGTHQLLSSGQYPPPSTSSQAAPSRIYQLHGARLLQMADPIVFEQGILQNLSTIRPYNQVFFAPTTVPGPYILRVVNGIAGGQQRITSGTVTLNAQVVIGPSQWNQTAEFISASVPLNAQNTIQIQTTGSTGSQAFITIEGQPTGDVNEDGIVDCNDLNAVRASFGKTLGSVGFNSLADVNADGVVDVRDLATVSRQLPAGTTCQ